MQIRFKLKWYWGLLFVIAIIIVGFYLMSLRLQLG